MRCVVKYYDKKLKSSYCIYNSEYNHNRVKHSILKNQMSILCGRSVWYKHKIYKRLNTQIEKYGVLNMNNQLGYSVVLKGE